MAGLQDDLGLSDHQYQVCITVLYVSVTPYPVYGCSLKLLSRLSPYIMAELPSNLLLRKIGPNILMPTILTIWGLITALQGMCDPDHEQRNVFWHNVGLVSSYAGLVVVRACLGLVEGPMFPGIVLYLSGFYTRKELALRYVVVPKEARNIPWTSSFCSIALFFSAASLSGAFSGLLAAAIENMHGIQGRPGWAWIFILVRLTCY